MKKIFCFFLCVFFAFPSIFASASVDFGLGSGYIFYGSKSLKHVLNNFDQSSQIILCADADFSIPLGESIFFTIGADSIIDARWKGSHHIYLWDYAALAGFNFYPDLGGLLCSVDYCLGRRTDFVSLENNDDTTSTKWGNGFAFALAYDFGFVGTTFAPVIAASWRHMPRGGSSDNILELKLRIRTK